MRLAEALRKQKMIEFMSLNNGFSRFGKQRVTSHDHAERVVTVLGELAGKRAKIANIRDKKPDLWSISRKRKAVPNLRPSKSRANLKLEEKGPHLVSSSGHQQSH